MQRKRTQAAENRSYLNRDFGSLRQELVNYASFYYSDYIKDFTEPSVASMLLDIAAYTADTTSFYLDYQFRELDLETAKDSNNVQRLIRQTGYKARGASPAFCTVDFYISVPAVQLTSGDYEPRRTYLPTIRAGTQVQSDSGVVYELSENLDYSKENNDGALIASYKVLDRNADLTPRNFSLKLSGICTSGRTFTEDFSVGTKESFYTIVLSQPNVTEILNVLDSNKNEYFEVQSLTHDTVFSRDSNLFEDSDVVEDSLSVISAPYRFVVNNDIITAQTTLVFGAGDAESLSQDVIADPADFSLPLFGDRKSFSYTTIDPNELLSTRTLGVAPENTTITVRYRAGGGRSHNAPAQSINRILSLSLKTSSAVPAAIVASMRASAACLNPVAAQGGTDAPTLDETRALALLYRNSQSRIVSKEDLVARIYSMPTNFGRVFRVGVSSNPLNPLSSLIYLVSRDSSGRLTMTSDTTKRNISKYINEFRIISDSYDILDSPIVNFRVIYTVSVSREYDKALVVSSLNSKIGSFFDVKNMYINQPIIIADIQNIILAEPGVLGIGSLSFVNQAGTVDDLEYSPYRFDMSSATQKGVVVPPKGGIFEIKFPNNDVIGSAF